MCASCKALLPVFFNFVARVQLDISLVRVEHEKIKFISTSGQVIFCLLYKHTDNDVFDDFPKISDYFPKICEDFPKLFRWFDERFRIFSELFPKITDDFRRSSKISEEGSMMFRSYSNTSEYFFKEYVAIVIGSLSTRTFQGDAVVKSEKA